jgi:hypothetical protein
MRAKLSVLLVSMLAVIAVGIVATASASAAPCEKKEGSFHLCLLLASGELELLETALILTTQESAVAHTLTVAFGTPLEVSCSEGTGDAPVKGEKIEGAVLTFSGCTVTGSTPGLAAACEIEGGKIVTKEIKGTLELSNNLIHMTFTPQAGTVFAEFTVKSQAGKTCLDAQSKGKVEGTQLCFWLNETGALIEEDAEIHLFECTPTGSTLKFAGKEAKLQDEWEALMDEPVLDGLYSVEESI